VVLAGRPNVGKSSLLNRLAGEERAIVTAVPGTTRDALRETILIDGVPINVVDTAGLRTTDDEVERLGVARTHRELAHADIVLLILDAAQDDCAVDRSLLDGLPAEGTRICVLNKIDLAPRAPAPALVEGLPQVRVSAKTGEGLDALRKVILESAGWQAHPETAFLARERHLRALQLAKSHLEAAQAEHARWELFAEELRLAQSALAEITGEVSADQLLGEIFSRFCIGK
jgi:tRNA modification GTPase